MTLFINTGNRRLEISDAYVMALTFSLVYGSVLISKQVLQKLKANKNKKKQTPKTKVQDLRGGVTKLKVNDDTELAFTILSCISDNENYLVKSEAMKEAIFNLVKINIKNESLLLTSNMIRVLALQLINKD